MFQLPELGYQYDSLGKYISKDIMELHHSKHHQIYVDKLNTTIDNTPELNGKNLVDVLADLESVPESSRNAIRNFGGGHYNHTLFWLFMSPNGGNEPTGKLADDIKTKYGSFQDFINKFEAEALAVFGSGWVWLQPDLSIVKTPNQDSPINAGLPAPVLGLDVWEHAYYLDYTYNRADYVKSWWNVVNWDIVSERYTQVDDRLLTL